MDLSLFGQSRDAERRRPAAHPVLAPGSPTPRARGPTQRSTQLNTLLWLLQSGASEDGHFLSLRRTQTLHSPGLGKSLNLRGFLSAMGSFVHYFSPTRKSEEPGSIPEGVTEVSNSSKLRGVSRGRETPTICRRTERAGRTNPPGPSVLSCTTERCFGSDAPCTERASVPGTPALILRS